jgi:2-polyprenyl-3-methyl-5-hydroxy-6-metoxy-1,4-benzoquinol methylase
MKMTETPLKPPKSMQWILKIDTTRSDQSPIRTLGEVWRWLHGDGREFRGRFAQLLTRFMKPTHARQLMDRKNLMLPELKACLLPPTSSVNTATASQVYYHLFAAQYETVPLNFFDKLAANQDFKYLDFGCGNCSSTVFLGKMLGLQPRQIFGTDIQETFEESWQGIRAKLEHEMTFAPSTSPQSLPFSESFDLITVNMVLHHITQPSLGQVCDVLHKHIKPHGLLVLKEHDCNSLADKVFADLQHLLFALSGGDADLENYWYRSRLEWNMILADHGFRVVYTSYSTGPILRDTLHPARNYFAIFARV